MKKIYTIVLCFYSLMVYSQEKKLCITVDDIPTITYNANSIDLENEITRKFMATFQKHKIPAIGYVVGGQLYKNGEIDSNKLAILNRWLENGYDLGNHTFSHYDYNKVSDSIFFLDIIKGETITRPLMKKYNKELKYFRHPLLHTGMDSAKSKSLHHFLSQNNYTEAPVTIDNDDYLFAKAYHIAYTKKDYSLMRKIGEKYVKYMEMKLLYFEGKSEEVFGRKITQTLLIHANLLNANYLDELSSMIKMYGYTFVSQEEALKDDAYKERISVYSKRGLSWIFRWGLSKGQSNEFMSNDIEVPIEIIEMAKIR